MKELNEKERKRIERWGKIVLARNGSPMNYAYIVRQLPNGLTLKCKRCKTYSNTVAFRGEQWSLQFLSWVYEQTSFIYDVWINTGLCFKCYEELVRKRN